ncbi:hypothetical protein OSTOST_19568, partial [Ostertagia ostertagi]
MTLPVTNAFAGAKIPEWGAAETFEPTKFLEAKPDASYDGSFTELTPKMPVCVDYCEPASALSTAIVQQKGSHEGGLWKSTRRDYGNDMIVFFPKIGCSLLIHVGHWCCQRDHNSLPDSSCHQGGSRETQQMIGLNEYFLQLDDRFSIPCEPSSRQIDIGSRWTMMTSEVISYDRVKVSKQAELLPKKGRLLCFVITTPKYHYTRVPAIHETWLPRCDHGQFFTTVELGQEIPHSTVLMDVPDDYRYLFQKTLVALHYAYTNISDQFDWYYKADDDTYVIMEHMYEYLATLDPEEPYYLGYNMRPYL